ncbi:hypothetical protein TTY48_14490 [Tsukamurella sp. TY48]|nr:hypothetical protein TTY48_14490 [Tsukamurella sp. TY48]
MSNCAIFSRTLNVRRKSVSQLTGRAAADDGAVVLLGGGAAAVVDPSGPEGVPHAASPAAAITMIVRFRNSRIVVSLADPGYGVSRSSFPVSVVAYSDRASQPGPRPNRTEVTPR